MGPQCPHLNSLNPSRACFHMPRVPNLEAAVVRTFPNRCGEQRLEEEAFSSDILLARA